MIGPAVHRGAFLTAALGAALAIPAMARDTGVPRVLIDERLNQRPVMLLGLGGGQITFADAGGMVRTESVDDLVAITLPTGEAAPPIPVPAVWLVDGQRFAGALRSGETAPDAVLWRHSALGGLDISMEDVARVVLRKPKRGSPARATETEDVLTLVNGDRLSGFLESFGQTVRLEVEGQTREIPPRRVAQGALANPARPAEGLTVWLADGSIVGAASVSISNSGEVTVVPALSSPSEPPSTEAVDASAENTLHLADVVAVAFDASRLVPLAALEPAAQRPPADRRWTEPIERRALETAVLGAADIAIPGPMTVEWVLPADATRFATDVELTPDLWAWGDCELVVSLAGPQGRTAELRRERLSAEHPRVALNVAITESASAPVRLRLTLEPGRYGSIQDRLLLRRPLVLVSPD